MRDAIYRLLIAAVVVAGFLALAIWPVEIIGWLAQ